MSYFAERLKALRLQNSLSMQDLADQAKVSKSMICKIEKEEVQPTIDVAARLARALGKTLSEMLHAAQLPKVVHLTKEDQAIWEDSSHIKRRNISPVFEGLKVEWVLVTLPPKTNIICTTNNTFKGEKILLIVKGTLELRINQQVYKLKKGDSFYFDARFPHDFVNQSKEEVEYYVVLKHD